MSSAVSAALRRKVIERANGICEFCLFREEDAALNFQIDHFQINGPLIVPITAIGEATVRLLRFNDDDRIIGRRLLQAAGRYP